MSIIKFGSIESKLIKYNDQLVVMDNFSLTPNWITRKFDLDHPSEETFLYADVASRGQVGQSDYPWEKLDALDKFKALR